MLNALFLLSYPATAARWQPSRGSGSRDGTDPENYSFVIVRNRKHLQAISTSVDKHVTSHLAIILDGCDGKVKVSDRVGSFGHSAFEDSNVLDRRSHSLVLVIEMGILESCLVGFTSLKGVHLGRMIAPGVNGDICQIGVNHNPPGSKIK